MLTKTEQNQWVKQAVAEALLIVGEEVLSVSLGIRQAEDEAGNLVITDVQEALQQLSARLGRKELELRG